MTVAPIVGPVHVSFVSNPWARVILTKDTFEKKKIINRIEFGSIWWKHTWYEFGAYRETTYCVLSLFFPIGIMQLAKMSIDLKFVKLTADVLLEN